MEIMKSKLFVLLFLSFALTDSYNMQLLSFLPYEENCSDITGFYQDGREFAVVGLQNAASFVDITDPYNPFELGRIEGSNSIWRDLKYWDRHVYIGTEANDGIKIVSVDNPDNPTLVNTITDVDNSHNVHVDVDGYLYIVGADEYDIWIYSLDDPANPVLVGTWTQEYCHDIEVYNNKLYCAAIYSGNFYIVDVQDKTNPVTLASHFTGIDGISTHDVAVTEDENYLFTGDENLGGHIKVWDISDYDNINLVDEYQTPNGSEHTSHNLYVRPNTNYLIISYYADGTRILDISDPENLQEIAYYDMSDIEGLYVSNWGVYAYLPSGNIISSDIEQGLFVLELGGVSILHNDIMDVDIEVEGPYVNFTAEVVTFDGYVDDVILHYTLDNITWNEANMLHDGLEGSNYSSVLTFDQSGVIINYYITASNNLEQSSRYPQNENQNVMFVYGDLEDIVNDTFETTSSWYVESDATSGLWVLDVPNQTFENGYPAQTGEDTTIDGESCWVTGNTPGENNPGQDDVDGGTTTLFSDIYNLSTFSDVLLTYNRWYTNNLGNSPGTDIWTVQVTSDGIIWNDLENTNLSNNSWVEKRFVLSDFIDLTSTVQFRFSASDLSYPGDSGSGGSLVEAAIDDFILEAVSFDSVLGDVNLDGQLDVLDVVNLINLVLDVGNPSDADLAVADLNYDNMLDVLDIVLLVNLILDD